MATVLIVEDCLTDAEVISSCLQKAGLTSVTVNNAREAKDRIRQLKPDAIVLDVVLPDGGSGYGLCRELKAEDETRQIPVVICSSKSGDMDKFWGLKQGAAAYLTKPIDQEELVQTVVRLIPA